VALLRVLATLLKATVTQQPTCENPVIPANLAIIAAVIAKLPKRQPMQQANNDINQALNL
jgi:hypothetical protein